MDNNYSLDSGMMKNTGNMTAAGNGTAAQNIAPQNLTTQTWGNEVPFSNTQLQSMSGMQTTMAPADSAQMMGSSSQMPETLTNSIYTPGYLRTQLGKWMRVEFLFGNNTTDRVGRLVEVGASYIILQSLEANSKMLCDIYSIRFVTIINNAQTAALYDTVYSN